MSRRRALQKKMVNNKLRKYQNSRTFNFIHISDLPLFIEHEQKLPECNQRIKVTFTLSASGQCTVHAGGGWF
jgi:hypothetical protein